MSASYEKRLKIPITGDSTTSFTTKTGRHIATGYSRIVIGDRGPYIEFDANMIDSSSLHIPKDQEYRMEDMRVYYIELRSIDKSNVKVYYQLKTVAYADYKLDMFYVTPFELLANGKPIIEKLCDTKAS